MLDFHWKNTACNGAMEGVPVGVVCIGGLESEGVLVVWSCR